MGKRPENQKGVIRWYTSELQFQWELDEKNMNSDKARSGFRDTLSDKSMAHISSVSKEIYNSLKWHCSHGPRAISPGYSQTLYDLVHRMSYMLKTRSQARLVPFFLPHAFLKRMPADTGLYCNAKSLHTSQNEATAYNGLQPPTGVASHLPPSVKISYAHMLIC